MELILRVLEQPQERGRGLALVSDEIGPDVQLQYSGEEKVRGLDSAYVALILSFPVTLGAEVLAQLICDHLRAHKKDFSQVHIEGHNNAIAPTDLDDLDQKLTADLKKYLARKTARLISNLESTDAGPDGR